MAQEPYFEEKFSFPWFQDRRWIGSLAAGATGMTLLIVYMLMGPNSESYLVAENAVAKWESSGDETSFLEMRRALQKVPELEEKYEATIAQKLFLTNRVPEALVLAHPSLKRLESEAPYHAHFGETTLLIEQGAYQDALERSLRLQEKMARELDWSLFNEDVFMGGSILYVHNLLRIACLHKELGNKPGEKAAWEALEMFLQGKESLAHLVWNSFQEKGLDFSDYIAERKKQL